MSSAPGMPMLPWLHEPFRSRSGSLTSAKSLVHSKEILTRVAAQANTSTLGAAPRSATPSRSHQGGLRFDFSRFSCG
jgi:hypothetical protein